MKNISIITATLLIIFSCGDKKSAQKPNVIVILVDDMGWGDIGYNNPENVYTPNLDRLAAEGVTFTQHYTMPQCTPTRVAAFTGRYPGRFGTAGLQASNDTVFSKGTPTLASMFKAAGYKTYLSGKWHMGSSIDHGPIILALMKVTDLWQEQWVCMITGIVRAYMKIPGTVILN